MAARFIYSMADRLLKLAFPLSISLVLLAILAACSSSGATTPGGAAPPSAASGTSSGASGGARLVFKETSHDFGPISHSKPMEYRFAFTNGGNAPLQVGDIKAEPIDPASCA